MYLHHDAFSTTGYQQLWHADPGISAGGEVARLRAHRRQGQWRGHLVKLGNTGWTQVVMPLAELGAEDKPIDGIWIQNATGGDLPKFYVTEIKIE